LLLMFIGVISLVTAPTIFITSSRYWSRSFLANNR